MADILHRGRPIRTSGDLPAAGAPAPDFTLVDVALAERVLADYAGKYVVLNIFPSIDTPVCAASVRRFNELAAGRGDTAVLCVSADLPFAHARFCGAEGIEAVEALSCFRDPEFGDRYGVRILDGSFTGLLARAVVVVGPGGEVRHTEMVPEIVQEPDYEAALAAIASA